MKDRFNNAVGPQVHANRPRTGRTIPVLAAATLVGGLQAASQFFAHAMRYQAALGPNLNQVYPPWAIIRWTATRRPAPVYASSAF